MVISPSSISREAHLKGTQPRLAPRNLHPARPKMMRPSSAVMLLLAAWNFDSSVAFHAALPRVRSGEASRVLGSMHSEHFTMILDDHTQVKLRKYTSTRDVMPGSVVQCLSLSNIDVAVSQRRRGHARRALRTLRSAANQNNQVLVVENVVSEHMHTLISQMEGTALSGQRPGAKGCTYWLPPKPGQTWQQFAVGA